jgi:hypothetical protein
MIKMIKKLACAALILVFSTLSAGASVIDANVVKGRHTFSGGFSLLQGFGLVATGDFALDNRMAVGGSVGYSFDGANAYLGDMHLNFQFVEPTSQTPLSMSLVGGLWGGTSNGLWLSKYSCPFYIQPEIGLAMSYMFDSRFTGRIDLVYGPSLGIELGYKIMPNLEAVFAVSEQVIGLKFRLF